MAQHAHSTPSVWEYPNPAREAAPLSGNTHYDVCVVGGGIAGLTTAYLLARDGKKVVVLESKPTVAGGETEFTTAHLAWYIDDQFAHVASVRGDDTAKLAAASHRAAIDLIEDIVTREKIACDFRRVDAYLFPGPETPERIGQEVEAMTRLGLPFERVDKVPFPKDAPGPALKFARHARFHPLKYLTEVAKLIRQLGGVIHTDTPVTDIRGGEPCEVETKAGNVVTAGAVVIAANSPFQAGKTLHVKATPYLTYAIAVEVPKGSVPDALYWDTDDAYHYVRLQDGEGGSDYLIVGGEDHKTGQADDTDERWGRLEAWTKTHFPQAGKAKHRWSGQVYETPDGLALIGLAPWNGANVYIITGDSGMGMTHGTLGARLVADLIQHKPSDLAAVYSPARWMVPGAAGTLLKDAANMAAQYTDWLTGGDVKSADEVPPGHGAVVRSGLTKLAVYKADDGKVTTLSAVCPHMGCIVRWNPGEQTWDCPCHGSRFGAEGKVMHGPATADLKAAE